VTGVWIVAVAALVLAAAALVLSVLTARQSGATASTLARHRHGHTLREGTADPGAARSARTGGRPEAPSYGPATTELGAVTPEGAPGPETAPGGLSLPRPGQLGKGPRP